MKRFQFIGGPWDGEWRDVLEATERQRPRWVHVVETVAVPVDEFINADPAMEAFTVTRYEAAVIRRWPHNADMPVIGSYQTPFEDQQVYMTASAVENSQRRSAEGFTGEAWGGGLNNVRLMTLDHGPLAGRRVLLRDDKNTVFIAKDEDGHLTVLYEHEPAPHAAIYYLYVRTGLVFRYAQENKDCGFAAVADTSFFWTAK